MIFRSICRFIRTHILKAFSLFILFHTGISVDALSQGVTITRETKFLKGFQKAMAGENFVYHSPLSKHTESLLVRSLDRNRHIVWETEPIPENVEDKTVSFIMMAAIDVTDSPRSYDLFIDDELWFTFHSPVDTMSMDWHIQGKDGSELLFHGTMIDRYGDLMGFLELKMPCSHLTKGNSVRIKVAGESADRRTWFMVFKNALEPSITILNEPTILRTQNEPSQNIRLDVLHLNGKVEAFFQALNGEQIKTNLHRGMNTFRLAVPATSIEKDISIVVNIHGEKPLEQLFRLKPVTPKEIHLLHHSHVDIGYTHVQEEVEEMQWDHLELAIELAKKSEDYPEEARFRWNTEVMWAVESYFNKHTEEKQNDLIQAIQNGSVEPNALFANELTGLCRPEELFHLFDSARKIGNLTGRKIESAMITDIPGYSWGMVPAMAQNGIKYFAIGTNTGHRIGSIISQWGDRPFFWISPSGQEKILCWIAEKGYSLFHTGLGYTNLTNRLNETDVLDYVAELEARNYPYDLVSLHYCIGSDNGPPDPDLSNMVKDWNDKYISPKMVISTVSRLFRQFEDEYGEALPVYSGDFTGYWEDGAASSARETAMVRQAAEQLVQAEVLWSMINPSKYPVDRFETAWKSVLLFNEHTWGSWNSISDPHNDFTQQQWRTKQSFAQDAVRLSTELLIEAVDNGNADTGEPSAIDVFNTNSWPRTDIVYLPLEGDLESRVIVDSDGEAVISQILTDGRLAFNAEDIPPLGMKRFLLKEKGMSPANSNMNAQLGILTNGLLKVDVDSAGTIINLMDLETGINYADHRNDAGLNQYIYVYGRKPDSLQYSGNITHTVKEHGPLMISLLIEADAPGCNRFTTEIILYDGRKRVDIINTIDKIPVYHPEAVYFGFPFNIENGIVRINTAWGNYEPGHGQLPGSCMNYFTAQRWIDISNKDYGMTMALIDAPLLEIGEITTDAVVVGWKDRVAPSQSIYSYVMNNYWETNYLAAQEGKTVLRYSLLPHGQYNSGISEKFGMERSQPLIAVPTDKTLPQHGSLLTVEPGNIIVTSIKPGMDGKTLMLRLFNAGAKPERVRIKWRDKQPVVLYIIDVDNKIDLEDGNPFSMIPYEILTLRAEFH